MQIYEKEIIYKKSIHIYKNKNFMLKLCININITKTEC